MTLFASDMNAWINALMTTESEYCIETRKPYYLHKDICKRKHGDKPQYYYLVLHECDNSRCINPNHVSWATSQQNQQHYQEKRKRLDLY